MNTNEQILCPECLADSGFKKISKLYRRKKAKENVKLCFGANYVIDDYEQKDLVDLIETVQGQKKPPEKKAQERPEATIADIAPPEETEIKIPPATTLVVVVIALLCAIAVNVLFFQWRSGIINTSTALSRSFIAVIPLIICFFIFSNFYIRTRDAKHEYWQAMDLWKKKLFCSKCGTIFLPQQTTIGTDG